MIELFFERLSNFKRREPVTAAIPYKKGTVKCVDNLVVNDGESDVISQNTATAKWDDGSVKWALVKFFAEMDGVNDRKYFLRNDENKSNERTEDEISVEIKEDVTVIDNGMIRVGLNQKGNIFKFIKRGNDEYLEDDIIGPFLNKSYRARLTESFQIIENGAVSIIAEGKGSHFDENGNSLIDFVIDIQLFKGCDWLKLDYRIINRQKCESVELSSLEMVIKKAGKNRLTAGRSNYRTKFTESEEEIYEEITANNLIYEANEHFPEVFYGTFFGDISNENGGVCATIFQAQQNFPKAFEITKDRLRIQLIPEKSDINIKYYRGMAKNHTIFLHFHDENADKNDINLRSLQFQLPDRPVISSDVYKNSGVFPDFFLENDEKISDIESVFIKKTDTRGKAYGILHWGDGADMHYTRQGRGNGRLVWINNEYDFPHTAMLMYAKNTDRRFLDYLLVSARHWMDIDVCHSSDDAIRQGAQIIHSADHISGEVEISHEWVEGLFDYYHMTGERFAYNTAIEIGYNIKRNLALEKYHKDGEINARETGWALRALVALYMETNDDVWLEEADFIVGHFESWERKYGRWLAPYTDHMQIRVPFMISIAVGSLMRYYNIKADEKIKGMILRAVDDMIENSLLDTGLFYYKEMPSLNRLGNNTTVLEALSAAFNFTGDKKYITAGIQTFKSYVAEATGNYSLSKSVFEDAVVLSGVSAKSIAQSYYPVAAFYTAAVRAGFREELI